MLLSACSGGNEVGGEAAPGRPLDLTILHINDHHSHLESDERTLYLLNAAGERVAVQVDAGGFARVATAFEEIARQSRHSLKLHAGDALTGTLYFNRAGALGEADATLMNTVCFDAFALGNHEFDKGDSELKSFLGRLAEGNCRTPAVSANVQFGPDSALHASRAGQAVRPYVVVERGGQAIGIVGLTIAVKTQESSNPDTGTLFEDEATAAQRAIDDLRARGVDRIVVLSHIGYENDRRLIAALSGVDAVVGGDSHSLLGPADLATYGLGTPAGPYAETLPNKDGDDACLVQAWEYSQVVGELKVSFDERGRVTACSGSPHVLIGDVFTQSGRAIEGADLDAMRRDAAASGFLRMTRPDPQASTLLQPFREVVEIFKQKDVAFAAEELCSRRVPGGPGSVDHARSSAACNGLGHVDRHGGDIQQLVAQAYLDVVNARYGGADITLQSGGGVRVPLVGTMTAASVIEVLPFGNLLWRLDITGAEVRDMIEDGLDAVFRPNGSTGPYPYAAGLRWRVDANQPRGHRASGLEVWGPAGGGWQPIDPQQTYRLYAPRFNAEGGDGYVTLRDIPASRRQDVGILDADVLQSYIDGLPIDPASGLPDLRRLPTEQYSTQSFIGPAGH